MRLHEQVKMQKELIAEYENGIKDLERYLHSGKFAAPNNHVNVYDIFLRLDEMKQRLYDVEYDYNL